MSDVADFFLRLFLMFIRLRAELKNRLVGKIMASETARGPFMNF